MGLRIVLINPSNLYTPARWRQGGAPAGSLSGGSHSHLALGSTEPCDGSLVPIEEEELASLYPPAPSLLECVEILSLDLHRSLAVHLRASEWPEAQALALELVVSTEEVASCCP